mgnify:FL=1|jgi:quinol monooxygenase YgiN
MERQLPIIVKFEVKQEKIEFVKSELIKILEPTRVEEGCLQYDLHQDADDESIFMFYEIWETKAHWKAHDKMKHIVDFKVAIEGCIEKISFNKLILI